MSAVATTAVRSLGIFSNGDLMTRLPPRGGASVGFVLLFLFVGRTRILLRWRCKTSSTTSISHKGMSTRSAGAPTAPRTIYCCHTFVFVFWSALEAKMHAAYNSINYYYFYYYNRNNNIPTSSSTTQKLHNTNVIIINYCTAATRATTPHQYPHHQLLLNSTIATPHHQHHQQQLHYYL